MDVQCLRVARLAMRPSEFEWTISHTFDFEAILIQIEETDRERSFKFAYSRVTFTGLDSGSYD